MSANTNIAWTDSTFNPWIGCTKVGPGCDNCYAKADFDDRKHRVTWGAGQARSRTKTWGDPVKWNAEEFWQCEDCGLRAGAKAFAKLGHTGDCPHYSTMKVRRRVFCASLADVFDNEVDPQWRADLFALIHRCENLDFLLLTKRVGNVTPMLREVAALLRDEHGTQTERKRGLQAGSEWGTGNRPGGANLACDEADVRPLDRSNEDNPLPPRASGANIDGRIPAGPGHDRREAAPCSSGATGLAACKGADTTGPDGQSQGRHESQEPSAESGAGDVQRATTPCDTGTECRSPRCEGVEAPESPSDGGPSAQHARAAGQRVDGEGHCQAVRRHTANSVGDLQRDQLEARSALLDWIERWIGGNPPPNVWLGATVVNQEEADRDIPKLLATPARVRFLSMEPLLGPVNLHPWLCAHGDVNKPEQKYGNWCDQAGLLHWVIAGGESGPGARPAQLQWFRSIVQQCRAADVPVMVKQLGGVVLDDGMSSPGEHWPAGTVRNHHPRFTDADPGFTVRLKDSKGGDITEWPEDLQVREFPK